MLYNSFTRLRRSPRRSMDYGLDDVQTKIKDVQSNLDVTELMRKFGKQVYGSQMSEEEKQEFQTASVSRMIEMGESLHVKVEEDRVTRQAAENLRIKVERERVTRKIAETQADIEKLKVETAEEEARMMLYQDNLDDVTKIQLNSLNVLKKVEDLITIISRTFNETKNVIPIEANDFEHSFVWLQRRVDGELFYTKGHLNTILSRLSKELTNQYNDSIKDALLSEAKKQVEVEVAIHTKVAQVEKQLRSSKHKIRHNLFELNDLRETLERLKNKYSL